MGIHNKSLQVGLSTIELLVTLVVASLFIAAGYSLHAFVLKDSGSARAEARANTAANEYLETYRVSSSTCTASTIFPRAQITVSGLTNVYLTVDISCPDGGVTATKKVLVTLEYNTPVKTIQISGYAGPETSDTQDYTINSFFNPSAPTTPVFYWNAVSGATTYYVRYKVDSGAWSSWSNNGASTSYTYTASEVFRNQVVTIQVKGNDGTVDLTASKTASATVPAWISCDLQNSWLDYGYSYNTAQFTKTSAGVVVLKGLVASGVTTSQTLICQLPVGFRPDSRLLFGNATNSTNGRVDVASDGRVEFIPGSNAWYTLNAMFLASTSGWTTLTSPSTPTWVDYGSGFSGAKAKQDSLGRTHIQGLVKSGNYNGVFTAYNLPSNFGPTSGRDIYASHAGGAMGDINIDQSAGIVTRTLPNNSYWSINALIYPNAFTGVAGWQTATLSNSWVNYGGTYSTAGYIKGSDGIVSLRGLIKSGTTTAWTALLTSGNKLPVGYRPKDTVICDVATSPDVYARIDVLTDGTVRLGDTGASASWISLAGCDFVADQ